MLVRIALSLRIDGWGARGKWRGMEGTAVCSMWRGETGRGVEVCDESAGMEGRRGEA